MASTVDGADSDLDPLWRLYGYSSFQSPSEYNVSIECLDANKQGCTNCSYVTGRRCVATSGNRGKQNQQQKNGERNPGIAVNLPSCNYSCRSASTWPGGTLLLKSHINLPRTAVALQVRQCAANTWERHTKCTQSPGRWWWTSSMETDLLMLIPCFSARNGNIWDAR